MLRKHFTGDSVEKDGSLEKENEQLYNQIGRLKMEVEWLKKRCCDSVGR